tara:strand:- start:15031 stop:16896 length:1866 start_codon:yes stop_codon:yes gene_type:complete
MQIFAQISPNKAFNSSNIALINDKVAMNGDEVLKDLIREPNPNTSSMRIAMPITEYIVGTTTYDLQTNAAVMDRIKRHNDGTISVAWSRSSEFNTSYGDRGTGYNFHDGNMWLTQPTARLESSRCGWPSMLATGSGKEIAIAHNTANSYFQMTYRDTIGTGTWNEQIVSSMDSNGIYRDLVWNRSVIGGINNESIHMIGVTAPSGLSGTIYNGLDGALLYYRSQDGGVSWDIQDMQLPTIDTSMFTGFGGDSYAIKAQGEVVCIASFGEWDDTFIMKSNDNGDTWTKTIIIDFPVDKYVTDSGLDIDLDGIMDSLYTTDGSGSLLLDHNGMAHVFAGNMRVLDADLTDAGSSYFPGTNGLLYWNENAGPDTSGQISNSVWWSDNMQIIAGAEDMDGDSVLNFVDIATYYSSLSSMPSSGIDVNGTIYVSFSSVMEGYDSGAQNFRHVNIIKSYDGGVTWTDPIDITPVSLFLGMSECVFASMERDVDDKVRLLYQKDMEPGLCVRGDEDAVGMNDIVYLELDTNFMVSNISNNINNTNLSLDVYPNPTNANTTISFTLDQPSKVSINVHDVLGRSVYENNSNFYKGNHLVTFTLEEYESGIYFINTNINNQSFSNKLILNK